MSEEEIKKIAREYAHLRAFDGGFFPKEDKIAEDFEVCLKLLAENYCIVPKEQIRTMQKDLKSSHFTFIGDRFRAEGAVNMMEKIFGKDLFEQKGE